MYPRLCEFFTLTFGSLSRTLIECEVCAVHMCCVLCVLSVSCVVCVLHRVLRELRCMMCCFLFSIVLFSTHGHVLEKWTYVWRNNRKRRMFRNQISKVAATGRPSEQRRFHPIILTPATLATSWLVRQQQVPQEEATLVGHQANHKQQGEQVPQQRHQELFPSQQTLFCQQARLRHQLWVSHLQEDVEPRLIEQGSVLVSSSSDCLGSAVALRDSRTNTRDHLTRAQN